MIPRVVWDVLSRDGRQSPFLRQTDGRPLRLTFDSSSLHNVPPEEAEALQALRELSILPELRAMHTDPKERCWLQIGETDQEEDQIL